MGQYAALLFDAIFGRGQRVYHTGGYLGEGEVVWLLARIDRTLHIKGEDVVEPYALMANSHDGSMAFNIRLTTVRVVCQNTLAMAINERLGKPFRRAHQGGLTEHARAAQEFFAATLRDLDHVAARFESLASRACSDRTFKEIVERLLPNPKKPRNADKHPGILKHWEERLAETRAAREKIGRLRDEGQGATLDGARGTFWGALNAILEFVDHYREAKGSRVAYALLGDGIDLKTRAFAIIQEEEAKAA